MGSWGIPFPPPFPLPGSTQDHVFLWHCPPMCHSLIPQAASVLPCPGPGAGPWRLRKDIPPQGCPDSCFPRSPLPTPPPVALWVGFQAGGQHLSGESPWTQAPGRGKSKPLAIYLLGSRPHLPQGGHQARRQHLCVGWTEGGRYTGMREACKDTAAFCLHLGPCLHSGSPVATQVRPDPPAGLGDGVDGLLASSRDAGAGTASS